MKRIFERGEFRNYKIQNLAENRGYITESYPGYQWKPTVFISHKHDDLDDLKGIIGFLQNTYGIKAYIDSQDPSMPMQTSGITASTIKKRISMCDKFILLATNGAIESKWCNWELGFGDAKKYESKNICIFPMKDEGMTDSRFKGNEYMSIYPYITYYNGTEKYDSGYLVQRGYYVREENSKSITPLKDWLYR